VKRVLNGFGLAGVVVAAALFAAPAQAADPDPGYPFELAFTGGNGQLLAAADFDGDGNQDLLWAVIDGTYSVDTFISWGNGDGTFRGPRKFTGAHYRSAQVMDVNGDGAPDIVGSADLALNGEGGVEVGVLLNDGDGNFEAASTRTLDDRRTRAFTLADVNGDGRDEVAVIGSSVAVMSIDEDGGLSEPTLTPLNLPARPEEEGPATVRPTIASGNFNGDAYDDLAVSFTASIRGTGPIDILDGSADGTLTQRSSGATDAGSEFLDAVDLNGDHLDDLVGTSTCTGCQSHASIVGFLTQPDGSMTGYHQYLGPLGYGPPAFGDFDGDGSTDIVAGRASLGELVTILGPTGEEPGLVARENVDFEDRRGSPSGTVVADFNGDGLPDVAESTGSPQVGQAVSGGTYVELNTNEPKGLGLVVAPTPDRISLHDLDRDGLNFDASCVAVCEVSARLRTKSRAAANKGLGGTMLSTVFSPLTSLATVNVGNHSKAMGKVMRSYRGRAFRARLRIVARPLHGDLPTETVIRKLRLKR